jgi:branched-chain amino acid transport system permease protein
MEIVMELFAQNLLNGITTGAIYSVIAIGFTLIFGIVQLIYFAQCEMAMVGAFAFAGSFVILAQHSPLPIAAFISLLLGCAFAVIISCTGQRVLLFPIRNSAKVKGLIVSLGFSIVLQNFVLLWISPNDLPFPMQFFRRWTIGTVTVTSTQLAVIAGTIITWIAIWGLLYLTRLGRSIRAIAQSRNGALLMGIRVDRVVTITFAVAAITATVAGVFMGVYNGQMRFDMGFVPGIKGFTVAILGGIGNIHGALLAGLMLGIGEGMLAGYLSSDYRDVFAFTVLVLVLLIRPQGLLGEGS